MLEARVGRLEEDMREVRADLLDVRVRVGKIEERSARMDGGFAAIHAKRDALPTVWRFALGVVATVVAVAALVLTHGP